MDSSFRYSIDLNEDQNHHEQPFYHLGSSSCLLHHQVPSNSSSSSSSISSLSSYLPFMINSQEDQHVSYNNSTYLADHLHLSQPLKAKIYVANGGSSSSYDHMVPKKETRLKLTIRKKDHHQDQTDLLHQNQTKPALDSDKWMMSPKMRLIKKTITNNEHPTHHTTTDNNNNDHEEKDQYPWNHKTNNFEEDHHEDLKKISTRKIMEDRYNTINENGYGSNNGVIRVCSDCNTTKTPLWRSGPRGPKSLCNACGIRQRKARRAAMAAAAAAGDQEALGARLQQLPQKKKLQNKKKRSNGGEKYSLSPPVRAKAKKSKIKADKEEAVAIDSEMSKSTTSSNSSISSNKLCFDDLTIMLSRSSAYHQQVFPQDEKEAAILLMALSYGMVHG